MDAQTEDFVQDLSDEAVFDSQGEFQVDLARAREKLEQHLGLWPEDYLAFLIQGAYALGASNLRLSTSWHSLLWEFDGPVLTRPQLEAILSEDRGLALSQPLQRLQMAFFLLSRSRYKKYTFASSLSGNGYQIEWTRGKTLLSKARRAQPWANALEIILPLRHISVHWLLSRRSALSTLPEYAAVRPRYKDGPLRLQVPWTPLPDFRPPAPLAIAIQGKQRMASQAPVPFQRVLHLTSETEHSLWFAVQEQGQLRCLVYSLGYTGPDWQYGGVWLYYDGLRTDLGQRQLVHGPALQKLMHSVEEQIGRALLQAFADPEVRQECAAWIWQSLSRWQAQGGGPLGEALAELALIPMAFHPDHSLKQLDQLYAASQPLYFCESVPQRQPPGAPPVVVMRPEFAKILRSRFQELRPCQDLFEQLEVREDNRLQWVGRTPESLELANALHSFALVEQGWKGNIGLLGADVAAKLDVFLDRKWVASLPLGQKFPKGLVGKVEHPGLQMNSTWTEPQKNHPIWEDFLASLWSRLPGWFAELLRDGGPEWLLDRAYDLLLAPGVDPGPLQKTALIPIGSERASLEECLGILEDGRWQSWILRGWIPRDRGWRLLDRLVEGEEQRRAWKTRLELYQKGHDLWKDTPPRLVTLTQRDELVASVVLPEGRGEIGLRSLKYNTVQVTGYRDSRRLGTVTFPGSPMAFGGLPEGLVAAVDHPDLWPNGDWTEVTPSGPGWEQALSWIWEAVPGLVGPAMQAGEGLLAVRLLAWLPRESWPVLEGGGDFVVRLDESVVTLAQAVAALEEGPPVRVLEDAGAVQMLEGFGDVWLIAKELAAELRSIWGPSRLVDAQSDYLSSWMAVEHGLSREEQAVLPAGNWLLREAFEGGEAGLRLQPGAANRCYLRLLRKGHLLMEYAWPLVNGPEFTSSFRLEVVVDWPEAPVLTTFAQLWEDPAGRHWLEDLRERMRLFGFETGAPREFLWERLAFEQDFLLDLDRVRLRLLKLPLFDIDGERWSLERVLAYVRQEGRLGYVLGDPIDSGAGPILFLTNRELHWLKQLLGQSHLANLSHIRKALRQRQETTDTPALQDLPLPTLDYLVEEREPNRYWGLQRELNGPSRVRLHREMRPLEALSYDWRYQVQASLNLDELQLNQDGRVRRDGVFQQAIEDLRAAVQEAIVTRTPARYRLEMALWSWGLQEPWAERLQAQPLLKDPRGQSLSVADWVNAWGEDEGKLPYLLEEEDWSQQLEILPSRLIPLLPSTLVATASRMMRGLLDYREGLRQAWQYVHQAPTRQALKASPPETAGPPLGWGANCPANSKREWSQFAGDRPQDGGQFAASYQSETRDLKIYAEFDWVEQHLVILWRGREVHRRSRQQWPGYVLEVDWSERLLGQAWPDWAEVTPALAAYWRFLHRFLQQPDLLEERLDEWEALPVDAQSGPIPVYFEPTEADLRLLLARRKAEWLGRARGVYAPVQRICEHWWGCPVEVETESGEWPLRVAESDGSRRLYLNPGHRWFQGRSAELMAVRVLYWLAGRQPGRDSLRKRNEILGQLGYLSD
ncbi:MAG: hypothetical protein KF760_17960 [Candidatus Eremiobacteraeota bacterium]|nr:hypothetical protein [Candidatus Eremiobacteraeota bacterium]MCW5871221.1 hypothetical protein [Candidatus Eremiobacteraeota bacterium]